MSALNDNAIMGGYTNSKTSDSDNSLGALRMMDQNGLQLSKSK